MHVHHRLLEIGHSHVGAVLLMYLWALLLGFGGVAASFSDSPLPILIGTLGFGVLGLVVLMVVGGRTVRRA
jgi:UDP-GlcNAc:undecaprenyl-phosphate GlcNAc-1-phosphate transferase